MAVAYKSNGALVSASSGTTLAVPIPALAASDYVLVVLCALASGTVTPPSGWAEAGSAWNEATLYYHVFWKRVVSPASATTETFTVPGAGGLAKATVLTGAANSAPSWSHVNNASAAYYQSPALTATGFYVANSLVFAARSVSGATTTTGTITSTNSVLTHETPSAITGYRWGLTTYNVSAVTSGNVRTTLTGGSATSDVIAALVLPDTGDVTDPVASVTSPAENDTVTGTITLTATLTDDTDVVSASATLDGTTSLGSMTNPSGTTWTLSVDTTATGNGSHSITVTALDAAGNSGTDTVDVTVSNAPPSTLSYFDGSDETALDATSVTYWDGETEIGFWYPTDGPIHQLSYFDGTTETILDLHDAPVSRLTDLSYAAYGDSYGVVQTASGVDYTSSDLFPQQLAAALSTTVTNRHVNSYMAMDVAYLMNNTSSGSKWVPGSFELVTTHVGGNDQKLNGDPAGLAEYVNGMRAIMALLRMATRTLASAASTTGTWSSVGTSGTSGGARSATASGAKLTFTATAEDITVFLLAPRDGSGSTFSITVDGGAAITGTTVEQAGTNPVVSGNYGLVPVNLRGLGSGSHTIAVTNTSASTLIVDSIGLWASDPGDVPYLLACPVTDAPDSLAEAAGITPLTEAELKPYRDALAEAIQEHDDLGKFGMVLRDSYDQIYWKPVADGVPLLISDGMHPNKAGCNLLAEVWVGNAARVFPA